MPKYGLAAFQTIWWWDEQRLAAEAEAANSCESAADCATSGSGR
jgi:hypothetical protein